MPELHSGRPQKTLPLVLKPNERLTVLFDVPFACVNDPARNRGALTGHEDFRYVAMVHHDALDGVPDSHATDDICPRTAARPYVLDGQVKERGCGTKLSDGRLGGDVVTDPVR